MFGGRSQPPIINAQLTAQQQVVIDYLARGRTLTNKVALTCLGVGSLSSRIAELRKLGYRITDRLEEDHLTRRNFKLYNLVSEDEIADT